MSPELAAARQHLEASDLPQAERLDGRILEADLQDKDALHEMGIVAIRIGKPEARGTTTSTAAYTRRGSGLRAHRRKAK